MLLALAAAAAPVCILPPGWDQVARRHPRYVLFGETHGTVQAPEMVAQVACALAQRGQRLLIAIEQSAVNDAALQAAWRTPADGFADRLGRVNGWSGRTDGVASEAMLAMLVRLHGLSQAGSAVAVTAFNGARDAAQTARFAGLPGQGPHEAAQADNIRDAAARGRYDVVLILCGSLHARKHEIDRGAARYRPMAMQLAPAAQIVSLRMVSGAGTMWNCLLKPGSDIASGGPIPADAIDCGNHPAGAMARFNAGPFVRIGDPPGAEGGGNYDGYVWLGAITGSAPARP